MSAELQLFPGQCLGQGCFGVTYQARYQNRDCIAKVLHSLFPHPHVRQNRTGTQSPTEEDIAREMQRFIGLSHRSLVQYYGFSSDPSSRLPILIMERMRESLTHFLGRFETPAPLHVQMDFSHDVALALSFLHQNLVVHGNLTSNNVLLSPDGSIKVSDFGIRGLFPNATAYHLGPCAIPFLPPESFTDPPTHSVKVDSFSWGVLTLQIMTGIFPDPTPAVQFFNDPLFPKKPQEVCVSEVGRRKPHIDRVRYSNPLLPVGVLCLANTPERRPLMTEISDTLAVLKTSEEYRVSRERVGSNWSARHMVGTISRPVKHYYEPIEAFGTKAMPTLISMGTGGPISLTGRAMEEELAEISLHEGGRGGREGEEGEEGERKGGREGEEGGEGEGKEAGEGEEGGEGERKGGEREETGREEGGWSSPSSPPTHNNDTSPPPPDPPNSEAPLQQNFSPLGEFSRETRKQCIRCEVCQREMRYSLRAEGPVSMVKCGNCKEITPVAPPPEGKVYERCLFCHNCILQTASCKRIVCPRDTCKNVLRFHTKSGRVVRRLPCVVCGHALQYYDDPTSTIRILTCTSCGEVTPVKSAPSGKAFSRCPYCNCCILHNSASERVVCPRKTCQKTVEVGDGERAMVSCKICQQKVVYFGKRPTVICGHCGECTAVGAPPNGKMYYRCSCNALLIHDKAALRVICPRKSCAKVAHLSPSLVES